MISRKDPGGMNGIKPFNPYNPNSTQPIFVFYFCIEFSAKFYIPILRTVLSQYLFENLENFWWLKFGIMGLHNFVHFIGEFILTNCCTGVWAPLTPYQQSGIPANTGQYGCGTGSNAWTVAFGTVATGCSTCPSPFSGYTCECLPVVSLIGNTPETIVCSANETCYTLAGYNISSTHITFYPTSGDVGKQHIWLTGDVFCGITGHPSGASVGCYNGFIECTGCCNTFKSLWYGTYTTT